jgi:hypothetical protein
MAARLSLLQLQQPWHLAHFSVHRI